MPILRSQWRGAPSIKGSSETMRMILLNFGFIGIHFCWSLESTYCTPLLLSLGLPKSQTSLVFIAGPLSGLLMQPVIGAITDRSTSKFGRRRPLMVIGGGVAGCCLLLLAWTKEVVATFVRNEEYQKDIAIASAILIVYVTDFTMNAIQTAIRSLMVDVLPISQQQSGSAWASRIGGFSSLVNYGIGALDLATILPSWFPGGTQFQMVAVISVLTLWVTTAVTCYSVTEKVLISSPYQDTSVWGLLPSIFRKSFRLPARVQGICWVQFWAWIGWFPFLFYSSTWVGETYYRYEHQPGQNESKHDVLGNVGRLGSLALLLFSTISFLASILLPYLVEAAEESNKQSRHLTPRELSFLPSSLNNIVQTISQLPRPTLLTAWLFSHLTFAFIIIWAPLVRSLAGANFVVGLCGIPWSVSIWAPFSEMGIVINRLAESIAIEEEDSLLSNGENDTVGHSNEAEEIVISADSQGRARSCSISSLARSSVDSDDSSSGQLAGIYMGVLNVYTTLPQFVGMMVSWTAFSLLERKQEFPGKDGNDGHGHNWVATNGVNAISVCFFVGALSALMAAESTRRLKRIS